MNHTLPSSLLSRIVIETPCRENWNSMSGDERRRHCQRCKKDVFNLSEMTEQEAVTLLRAGRPVCMRLFRRPDGTVLTKECGVGLRRRWRARAFLSAVLFAILTGFGLRRASADDTAPQQPPPDYHELAGGISLPRGMEMGDVAILPTVAPTATQAPAQESPQD